MPATFHNESVSKKPSSAIIEEDVEENSPSKLQVKYQAKNAFIEGESEEEKDSDEEEQFKNLDRKQVKEASEEASDKEPEQTIEVRESERIVVLGDQNESG